MKKDIAMKWVKALRSGKYRQGAPGEMRDGAGGYCCLGVLNEIICDMDPDIHFGFGFLSEGAREFAGMKDNNGYFTKINYQNIDLAGLNDGVDLRRRATFAELADVIEEEYKSL